MNFQCEKCNEAQLLSGARYLASVITAPATLFFHGELGAGKTTFIRAFIQAYGYREHIKSPTYTLVETYHFASTVIHHFDLYRLSDASELYDLGIDDYFSNNAIVCIEWPERGGDVLPQADGIITLTIVDETLRSLHLTAVSVTAQQALSQLKELFSDTK